jgi:hypothetical protein
MGGFLMQESTAVLNEISGALDALAAQAISLVPQEESFMQIWGWNLPAINKHEFAAMLREPVQVIRSISNNMMDDADFAQLAQYPARIYFIRDTVMNNLAGGNAFHVYLTITSLLDGLNAILSKYASPDIDWKKIEDQKIIPAVQLRKLKSLAAGVDKLSENSEELALKITAINEAHSAAEALPTDMEELHEARKSFNGAIEEIAKQKQLVIDVKSSVDAHLKNITALKDDAELQVKNIDAAYSAATTQGLGKAFGDKAIKLKNSTWVLLILLGLTLGVGACISSMRIDFIHELMKIKDVSMTLLWVNVILTVVSVGAPVWFAWILTKQIGQRFRLAEDYDFKASMAKAYEGYRREAVSVDPEQAKRLFALAVDRLSEEPLRHIEKQIHSTPFQEFAAWLIEKKVSKTSVPSDIVGK